MSVLENTGEVSRFLTPLTNEIAVCSGAISLDLAMRATKCAERLLELAKGDQYPFLATAPDDDNFAVILMRGKNNITQSPYELHRNRSLFKAVGKLCRYTSIEMPEAVLILKSQQGQTIEAHQDPHGLRRGILTMSGVRQITFPHSSLPSGKNSITQSAGDLYHMDMTDEITNPWHAVEVLETGFMIGVDSDD